LTLIEERSLVLRAKGGDIAALGELLSGAYAYVLSQCRSWSPEHFEDIAQEAAIKAHRRIGQFAGACRFRTWIYSIAYREFLMSLRPSRQVVPGKTEMLEELAFRSLDGGYALVETRIWLEQEAEYCELTEKEKRILLYAVEGCSNAEIQFIVGDRTLGTTKSNLSRARAKMRLAL
jgi:RNA polymerase sigma-70 factor, ECF subfamily